MANPPASPESHAFGALTAVLDDRGTYLVSADATSDVIATVSPYGASGFRWHHLVSGRIGVTADLATAASQILEIERTDAD